MKLSNFKLERVEGTCVTNLKFFATVDVTTGFIFKKTVTKNICRKFAGFYFFVDTGEYVPDEINKLTRAYSAKTGEAT